MGKQLPTLPSELANIPFEQAQFDFMVKMLNDIGKVRKKNKLLEGIVKFLVTELKVLNDWHSGERKFGRFYDSLNLTDLNVNDLDIDQLNEVLTEKIERKTR